MKKLLLILILVVLAEASQASQTPSALKSLFPNQTCIDVNTLGYVVAKKIAPHIYELRSPGVMLPVRALVKTKSAEFNEPGMIRQKFGMEYVRSENIDTDNGFAVEVDMWKECTE